MVFTYKTYEEMLDLLSIMVLDNVEPCEITYKMMVRQADAVQRVIWSQTHCPHTTDLLME